ncbi:MAG: hypothetical protein SOY60_03905 [Fusobacterium gastrosuis]|uniref:hypothetical protein n=1 Tax=Fusobacterium gastrosuis TaxID=1755100 RepID=UPI002A8C5AE9|nr:hypothetical protein [Fusobacterium gastrosuis]
MAKLWKQIRIATIGELIFDYENIDIEFEVRCTDDNKPDTATIRIYNLSETTKNKIEVNQVVNIDAGYRELHQTIFGGLVESIRTYRDGNDLVTIIEASSNNRAYTNTIVNVQFASGISASEILKQLEKTIPFKIEIKELGKDTVYPNGKVFSNRLSNIIPILAKDTGTIARFTDGIIEFKKAGKSYSTSLKMTSEQGLIRVEKKEEKAEAKKDDKATKKEKQKYNIEAFLVPLVKIGQQLEVESMEWTGTGIVKECTYVAGDITSFTVNAVVEVI